jgi:DNA-binding CsgD family transcriptional regulator
MSGMESPELRRALAFVEGLHAERSVRELRLHVERTLPELIPCDVVTFGERSPESRHELDLPGCLSLGRSRADFTDAERDLLALLRPQLIAAEAEAGLRDALAAGAAPDEAGASGLTERELEVLRLAAYGGTNKQLGLELGISPRTVQKHFERIHAKLGVSTRTAAVAAAAGVLALHL